MLKKLFKRNLVNALWIIMGRNRLVRFARFLSNESRLDVLNEMSSNGEKDVQKILLSHGSQSNGLTVFDAGANIGLWTQSLFEEAEQGGAKVQVHAFEACRGTYQQLKSNLRSWGLEPKVIANQCALSSTRGQAKFYTVGDGMGRNSLYPLDDANPPAVETVPVETLDHYCQTKGIARIDLLKIDTEGNDFEVIRGAESLLKGGKVTAIQFEYNHRWIPARHFLRDIFEYLAPLGYAIGKVTARGVEFYPSWDLELETFREANFLAVRCDHVQEYPQVSWWKEAA